LAANDLALKREENKMGEPESFTEEIQTTGDELVAKVKELVREGNVRRVIVKDEQGKTLIEIPLTLGVVGALFLPVAAAVGAVAALATNCTLIVEKVKDA
jgi:CBS domain-containing protein